MEDFFTSGPTLALFDAVFQHVEGYGGLPDLQAVKASGVTFVASLLERVIEEQARGDAARAEGLRRSILSVIGNSLHDVRPGSPGAARLSSSATTCGSRHRSSGSRSREIGSPS